jgi:hypothetical protein
VYERYELPPDRLERWLDRWAGAHGGVVGTRADADGTSLTIRAADGAAVVCTPPFPPLAGDLLEHVRRERTVGVLLVRLGGHAAGVFAGRRLVASKVGSRPVHGRHRAGGSSAGRFARRRAGQARVALQEATSVAARVLVEPARRGELDAVVRGGDRGALERVLADARLAVLRPLLEPRVLDVPDPRLRVLELMPQRFLATVVQTQAED